MKYIIDEAISRAEIEGKAKSSSMVQSDEELVSVLEELTTVIRVIGCGGGGSNTIDRLSDCGIQGAELYAVNTMLSTSCTSTPTVASSLADARPAVWGLEACQPLGKRQHRRI